MRELHNPGAMVDDHGHQTGTGRQHRLFLVFPPPIWDQFRDPSRAQVKREHFRELLDPEWTMGYRETLQKSIGVLSVRIIDVLQDTLVCLVQ